MPGKHKKKSVSPYLPFFSLKATSRSGLFFSPQGRWMDKFAPEPRPEEIRQMIAKLEVSPEANGYRGGCFINL